MNRLRPNRTTAYWWYGFWVFFCTIVGASTGLLLQASALANSSPRAVPDVFWEFPAMLVGAVLGYGISTIAAILVRNGFTR